MPPRRIPLYARKPRKFSHFQRFPPVQNFYDIASNQPWNPLSQPLPADSSTQHSRPAPPRRPKPRITDSPQCGLPPQPKNSWPKGPAGSRGARPQPRVRRIERTS